MVTKAKEVPWNEVEDLMEDLHQWLVTNAAAPEREAQHNPGDEPRCLEPLEIAMETVRFVQVTTGIQLAATATESELARKRTSCLAEQLGHPGDIQAIGEVAEILHQLCMYNARGLRGLLLGSTNNEHSARAKQLLYDDAHVRAAEEAVHRIVPAIETARKKVLHAVNLERERHRALPELQAELRPELRDTPVTAGPDWPQHIEEKAHELARLLEETKSAAQELSDHFSAFFEPGRPRFPMTVAGWQALRGDVSSRLERVGWLATKNGIQKSQSRST
jgi:hypothetical protein